MGVVATYSMLSVLGELGVVHVLGCISTKEIARLTIRALKLSEKRRTYKAFMPFYVLFL